jgi:hypothetical protein
VGAVSEELRRLSSFEERHRRLLARLTLVVAATAVVDACGTAVIYFLERHAHGTEVQSVGQAFFFTTVQLLTVSSQLKNPITPAGRALDIALELWAIIVVAERQARSRPSSRTRIRSNLPCGVRSIQAVNGWTRFRGQVTGRPSADLFDATGDLAKRKLLPGLFHLMSGKGLPGWAP